MSKKQNERRPPGRHSHSDATKPLSNARHERFAQLLAEGRSADAAYAGAGYKPHKANPTRLRGNERIGARVAAIQAAGAEKAAVTVKRVLDELAKIAFSSIGSVVDRWDASGVTLKSSDSLHDNDKAAISEVSESRLRGERTVRVRMHSKIDALDKLCRHLGMFRERIEHSGPGGGPIETRGAPVVFGVDLDTADEETLKFLREKVAREAVRGP
jgi:phage terminase small subunit